MENEISAIWERFVQVAKELQNVQCNKACDTCPFGQTVGEWYNGGTFDICDVVRRYTYI